MSTISYQERQNKVDALEQKIKSLSAVGNNSDLFEAMKRLEEQNTKHEKLLRDIMTHFNDIHFEKVVLQNRDEQHTMFLENLNKKIDKNQQENRELLAKQFEKLQIAQQQNVQLLKNYNDKFLEKIDKLLDKIENENKEFLEKIESKNDKIDELLEKIDSTHDKIDSTHDKILDRNDKLDDLLDKIDQ